jgi:hypothetical protein
MGNPDKAVFISYRRKLSPFVARAIFENLTNHDYDVFMDVESIDSGTFKDIIFHQIAERAHFLAVLTPGALEATANREDWLRREIEHAIESRRNIVPVMAQSFDFDKEAEKFAGKQFPGGIEQLRDFNGVDVPHEYFGDAMRKLRERFLKKPITVATKPAPKTELADVRGIIGRAIDFVPTESILNKFGLKASPFSKIPWFTMEAPTLSKMPSRLISFLNLKWTTVLSATKYVLEGSNFPTFVLANELQRSDKTFRAVITSSGLRYFRVKAENEVLKVESPWSNVVAAFGLDDLMIPVTGLGLLPAPKLEVQSDEILKYLRPLSSVPVTIKWTTVLGASSYVLEKSDTQTFAKTQEVYKGSNTAYEVYLRRPVFATYFRVKAIGISSRDVSLWSNVVEVS